MARGRKKKSSPTASTESFAAFFSEFCENYDELINSYEDAADINFITQETSIHKALQSLNNITNYEGVLVASMHRSIKNSSNVVDEIYRYNTKDVFYDKTSLQRYFDDVGAVYKKNNNEFDIEYCPENRDKLIEMNLKSVITIAKGFRGNRLSLEELISAGNEGLCVAFDKYDPNKQKLKNNLIDQLNRSDKEEFSYDDVVEMFDSMLAYGSIKAAFKAAFEPNHTYSKDMILKWISKNIRPAKFNSVAVMWIIAYILIELDNYSRLIKKPKREIKKERTGESQKEVYIDLSEPTNGDGSYALGDVLEDDAAVTSQDIEEAQNTFRDALKVLLKGVKLRNKRITLQRYGIGLPRPMSPKEISQREGISIARVSQIIQTTLDDMRENYKIYKDQIDPSVLCELLEDCEYYM